MHIRSRIGGWNSTMLRKKRATISWNSGLTGDLLVMFNVQHLQQVHFHLAWLKISPPYHTIWTSVLALCIHIVSLPHRYTLSRYRRYIQPIQPYPLQVRSLTGRLRNHSFRILVFSLVESFCVWCLISVENCSLVAFLSALRTCLSAFTACLRIFFSSFVSFFGLVMVVLGAGL